MTEPHRWHTSRRDFLTGRSLQSQAEQAGSVLAAAGVAEAESRPAPEGGPTMRLGTRAMACDFSVVMNPGPGERVMAASDALEMIHALEAEMTVYRTDSELSGVNRSAFDAAVPVSQRLFRVLHAAQTLGRETEEAFDPTSGPLIALWRQCRTEGRVPNEAEISTCLERTGIEAVVLDGERRTVRFRHPRVELNLGGIGKGYALDCAAAMLHDGGINDWLIHGGHSSLLAFGEHNGTGGWPVGIRNPLFPKQRLATVLMKDRALSSSGSGVQHFRHAGKRYGHILDPRCGRPVEGMLSVTVLAPTAAEADALSTGFFVMGVEKAARYCDNFPEISALLIPTPQRGRKLEMVTCGVPEEVLFFSGDAPLTVAKVD